MDEKAAIWRVMASMTMPTPEDMDGCRSRAKAAACGSNLRNLAKEQFMSDLQLLWRQRLRVKDLLSFMADGRP